MCGVAVSKSTLELVSEKIGKTRISYLSLVERGKESRRLVFWSLGTLAGLTDRVRGLVA
jgi:hypothetical protein